MLGIWHEYVAPRQKIDNPEVPRPIIAYYRVSTPARGRSGLGLEAQRKAVAQFAGTEALEVAHEFIEIETGKGAADALDKRPQLAAALRAAKKLKAPTQLPSSTG
jgi:DNA invertase Pin-like site-specific DNA recombinase